jgi:uncharacterized membrane protein YeiB
VGVEIQPGNILSVMFLKRSIVQATLWCFVAAAFQLLISSGWLNMFSVGPYACLGRTADYRQHETVAFEKPAYL